MGALFRMWSLAVRNLPECVFFELALASESQDRHLRRSTSGDSSEVATDDGGEGRRCPPRPEQRVTGSIQSLIPSHYPCHPPTVMCRTWRAGGRNDLRCGIGGRLRPRRQMRTQAHTYRTTGGVIVALIRIRHLAARRRRGYHPPVRRKTRLFRQALPDPARY